MPNKLAPVKDAKAAALVAEAADLLRQERLLEQRLDEIKAALRDKADAVAARRPDPKDRRMVEFESDAGVCSVIFMSEIPHLASGADPEGLMARYASVSRPEWDRVFRRRFLLAPGWQQAMAAFPANAKRAVNRLIDWEPATPRVVLPK